MLNSFRNTYWICQRRKVVKQVMKDCDVCYKAQAGPLRGCEPPGLPSYSMYECTRRYKYLKTTIEHFWNRFSQEYMNNLHGHQHIAEENTIYYHR